MDFKSKYLANPSWQYKRTEALTARLPKELIERLEQAIAIDKKGRIYGGVSKADIVIEALDQYLTKLESPE